MKNKFIALLFPMAILTASSAFAGDWADVNDSSARYKAFNFDAMENLPVMFFNSGTGNSLPIIVETANIQKPQIKITVQGATEQEADSYLAAVKVNAKIRGVYFTIPSQSFECQHKETKSSFVGYRNSGRTESGWNWSVKSGIQTGEDKSYIKGVCLTEIRLLVPSNITVVSDVNNGRMEITYNGSRLALTTAQQLNLILNVLPGSDSDKLADLKTWARVNTSSDASTTLEVLESILQTMQTENGKLNLIQTLRGHLNLKAEERAELGHRLFPQSATAAQKVQTILKTK